MNMQECMNKYLFWSLKLESSDKLIFKKIKNLNLIFKYIKKCDKLVI